ncbi:MAG: hypothetical protein AAF216_13770 [Pseudomonadota bacterium]
MRQYKTRPDADHRYFIFDGYNNEFYYYATPHARDAEFRCVVDTFMDDFWDEGVEQIVCGEVTHVTVQADRTERPAKIPLDEQGRDGENEWSPGLKYVCDYKAKLLTDQTAARLED